MIPLAYNVRNLTVRKTTSAATAIGLALVVFVFAGVLMLSNGIKKTLGRAADPNMAIVLRKGSTSELESSIEEPNVGVILSAQGVAHGSDGTPQGQGELMIVVLMNKIGTNGFSNVQVRGVPDGALSFRPDVKLIEGRAPRPGTDEVMVGKAIRGRFEGVDLGKSFDLKKNRAVNVVGVFSAEGASTESEVWAGLDTVRTTFGREGLVSSVHARLESPTKFDGFKTWVDENRQLGLEVQRESDYYEKQSQGTSIFITAIGILVTVFFAFGAMIGAMITMYGSIANRQREIGTLRALGFSRTSIITSFLLESTLLALVGGGFGAAASTLLGMVKFSMMNFASWSEIVFTFEPTPGIIVSALIGAGIMGLLGGIFPAVRAARMNPITAMRG
jgi:putative ABC transport system permease protein